MPRLRCILFCVDRQIKFCLFFRNEIIWMIDVTHTKATKTQATWDTLRPMLAVKISDCKIESTL